MCQCCVELAFANRLARELHVRLTIQDLLGGASVIFHDVLDDSSQFLHGNRLLLHVDCTMFHALHRRVDRTMSSQNEHAQIRPFAFDFT
jgi:hypothetical protein